ncbi:MAG: trypsin-like peptidase domain-containing protein [Deltaproteobacteria bacterium]|nr:trypsin-like peptidase domain-containing protein [Deltaproteobacteria bacterium]
MKERKWFKNITLLQNISALGKKQPAAYKWLNDKKFAVLQQDRSIIGRDNVIDNEDAYVLSAALHILGSGYGRASANIFGRFVHFDEKLSLPQRINELGADKCWLTQNGMRLGLFGMMNFESVQYVDWFETTAATIFECPYLPSMHDHVQGLFFRPENMSSAIRQASESVVKITVRHKRDKIDLWDDKYSEFIGTGFAVFKHGYILTARHVTNMGWDGDSFIVTYNGKEYFADCQAIIDLPRVDGENLDLAILYVRDLPQDIVPLNFAKAHFGDKVYGIGFPHQETEKSDMLVACGSVDFDAAKSTIVNLPGSSGGPVVNDEGEVVGVNVLALAEEFGLRRMRIIKSEFVPVGEHDIRTAIEETISSHERGLKSSYRIEPRRLDR